MDPKVKMLWVLGNICNLSGDLKNVLLELTTCTEFCGCIKELLEKLCYVAFFNLLVYSKKKQVSY